MVLMPTGSRGKSHVNVQDDIMSSIPIQNGLSLGDVNLKYFSSI